MCAASKNGGRHVSDRRGGAPCGLPPEDARGAPRRGDVLGLAQVGEAITRLNAGWHALRLFGHTEGVVLDPVYTGKVAAALVDWKHILDIDPGEPVVFLHTGGMPGLYGYAPELAAAVDRESP